MAKKTTPALKKGQRADLIGWQTRTPGTVMADATKTHAEWAPDGHQGKPWLVLLAQLQAVES